jgi:transcriptional regulator
MKTNSQKKRINIALLEAGICQADIARELGTTRQYVSNVISGLKHSRKVEDILAARTGKHVEYLFSYRQDNENRVRVNEESRRESSCRNISL